MDKFQAAFEVLCFLSAVDGKVDKKELDVINNFLSSNYGNIDFDANRVASSIGSMSAQGMMEELERAALVFKRYSSAQDRVTLLEFALDLVAADGKITEEEKGLFFILGNTWNIDIKNFLARRL